MNITTALEQLEELNAQKNYIGMKKQEIIETVLSLEIRQQLKEIDEEFEGNIKTVDDNITALKKVISQMVVEHGSSVKGATLQAVYSKARVTWNTDGLDGYALTHPEINQFRKVGEPSVSIR